ncbi:MAG TPA: DUF3307 domain-containing protein [Flavobacterium sp.]|jgi:hypothetical protein|uniref:DUF3307 domain-containing protein n=1 Tax=Flavobacterium sp. TaxID=239 RepID=UPI001B4040BF|nr:DUF3307 domain-containing protein [Flavobacterium sp.]MBP7183807.1 DUF3307 domain-containing protein [Flavobacterium sp.]MBP7318981.1 DUF3307 domain-containing protein [Flavobacterium sp.]HRL72363.1 DUF3307 domain-containing protein [Flavobacterium sp.]HRM47035.1 DUF3307 domain-containing protein [Flavobacterium sp.]HRN44085.1 DUF3307 domain-containing protein [Flavobacterium sp.]
MLFIKLVLAHFLGDFVLQSSKWITHKEKYKFKSKYLYIHALIHAILLLLMFDFKKEYYLTIAFISSTHFLIDGIKLLKPMKNERILFFLDQLAHIGILFWVANSWSLSFDIQSYITEKNLLFLLAIVLLTAVTSIVLKVVFSCWKKEIEEISKKDSSLENAGKYIGMLERLLVFSFIVLNKWEAIGFLLAAKSVFRFGDLTHAKDRQLTEYILIGTLLSFGSAILIGLAYLVLLPFFA